MYILESIVTGCASPDLSRLLQILKNILTLVQIIGPILLIVSMTVTFTQLTLNPDEKKLKSKLKNELFAILFLFSAPFIVNGGMVMVDDAFSVSRCWNSISDYSGDAEYKEYTNREKSALITKSSRYEPGEPKEYASEEGGSSSSSSGEVIEGIAQSYKDVVWDSGNITRKSNLTSAQLIKILNAYGSNAVNYIPYATNYVTAENKYGINVFYLMALNALESGWGTSNVARSCNNWGGVCESSYHPSYGCASNSNCAFARFNSPGDFIDYNAKMLNENYTNPSGVYFEGLSLSAVYTRHYCPNCYDAAREINNIATGLFNKTRSVM